MAEILCINLTNLGDLANAQDEVESDEDLAIKNLTDIVAEDAEKSETVDEISAEVAAVGEEDTEGYVPAIDGQSTTLTTFTKDLDSSSDEVPLPGESFDGYGQFTNYAAQQLYQDISTAFTQRTLVGLELKADAAGEPDAALNHYLTVAIISFVNRIATIGADDGTTTLDEAGE